ESEATSLTSVLQRLKCLVGECDIKRKTCCVPMCGRVFDSVPVLAFHMSYSHHDLAVKSAYDTLCFRVWSSDGQCEVHERFNAFGLAHKPALKVVLPA
ncbi:hypothetical protein OESDEN_24186, partial [Oesophagostomum dentatum]